MFKRCACPVSLTCIHTQHQAMWRRLLAVETLPIDRWHIARTTGEDLRARSIAIEVKHETLPANRTRLLAAPVDLLPVLAVDLLACSRRRHCSPTRDGHQPVMTGHNARRPRTGRERRPWWWPSEASYLTVRTLNDRFFASLVHCMLRRLLSEYWRKETEKSKVFCGVVGLDGRCSAQAEQRKKPVAVGPLHYCSRNIWATYGLHMGHIWGPVLQHMELFSTYGEENPSESTTYGQHMGLFFKHMGFFWNI